METFKPPDYIASLIASINDGARSAQAGALAFTAIGFYLLATAFSTTDEDFLRENATAIAPIGVSVPIVISFAIAPAVFVALHVFTLVRYDMLAVNLGQFSADLQEMVPLEADKERCRELLASVEFVQALTAPVGSPLRSMMFNLVSWAMIAVFPLIVIVVVVISTLRFQDQIVTWVQKIALIADVLLLAWFVCRRFRIRAPAMRGARTGVLTLALLWVSRASAMIMVMAVALVMFAYANVAGPQDTTVAVGRDYAPMPWRDALDQPLDLFLCPRLHWGCRYLAVDHRMLINRAWNDGAIARLNAGSGDAKESLAAIEGMFLGRRNLLFANFNESRLYAADLDHARLQGATFNDSGLEGANFVKAELTGANLRGARLANANLSQARLDAVDLFGADLKGAQLAGAELQGANLVGVDLQGADLSGADLSHANLPGADLAGADLRGAVAVKLELQGANLSAALLQGALLAGADLQGADLAGADLSGANLSSARLHGANLAGQGNATLTDLRGADLVTPIDRTEEKSIREALAQITDARLRQQAERRLQQGLARSSGFVPLPSATTSASVLVERVDDPRLAGIEHPFLTTDEVQYAARLAEVLAAVAVLGPATAHGIAAQVLLGLNVSGEDYSRGMTIACRLLADVYSGKLGFAEYGYSDVPDLEVRFPECPRAAAPVGPAR